ncbi:hypothetical protein JNM87_01320 [Candidatus Saccharibacteria bacterium]|nr:hypothetical protein [Candidatus Saccharibacteria bacterium]
MPESTPAAGRDVPTASLDPALQRILDDDISRGHSVFLSPQIESILNQIGNGEERGAVAG